MWLARRTGRDGRALIEEPNCKPVKSYGRI
jgi:hypothetical protein